MLLLQLMKAFKKKIHTNVKEAPSIMSELLRALFFAFGSGESYLSKFVYMYVRF
jgi:hypothetical protein